MNSDQLERPTSDTEHDLLEKQDKGNERYNKRKGRRET